MIPAVIITALIVFLSVTPSQPSISTGQLDKAGHFIMYAVAAWAYLRAARQIAAPVVLCALLGITMEIVQYFLAWRSFSLLDIAANCAGIAAATFLWVRLKSKAAILSR